MSALPRFSRAAPPALRETAFSSSAADFQRVRELIHRRAGIGLHAGKQAMVYSRLSRRLRELGQPTFASRPAGACSR